jgi:uncharacterized protein (DUF427 family)
VPAPIKIVPSSQRVRVELEGVTLAETTQGTLLHETGLPVRFYFPKSDVQMDLLTPTEHSTRCPYKGKASYWSVTVQGTVYENLAWAYESPVPKAEGIAGLIAFYNEKTRIYVDGMLEARPGNRF